MGYTWASALRCGNSPYVFTEYHPDMVYDVGSLLRTQKTGSAIRSLLSPSFNAQSSTLAVQAQCCAPELPKDSVQCTPFPETEPRWNPVVHEMYGRNGSYKGAQLMGI